MTIKLSLLASQHSDDFYLTIVNLVYCLYCKMYLALFNRNIIFRFAADLQPKTAIQLFFIESLRWMRATTGFDKKIDMN